MSDSVNVVQFPRRIRSGLGLIITEFKSVSPGATGEYVKQLQQQLHAWGFTPGSFDGVYGDKTKSAVAELQKVMRVSADGIFGPNTVAAVTSDLGQTRSILRDREDQFLTRPQPPSPPVSSGGGSGSTAIVRSPNPSPSVSVETAAGDGGIPGWLIGAGALAVVGLVALFWPSGGGGGISGGPDDSRIPGDDYLDAQDPFDFDEAVGTEEQKRRAKAVNKARRKRKRKAPRVIKRGDDFEESEGGDPDSDFGPDDPRYTEDPEEG